MDTATLKKALQDSLAKLENPKDGEFQTVEFAVGSGDFYDQVGITYEYQHKEFKYETQWCGDAYSRTVGVKCREIGVDAEGAKVYQTPEGVCFVAVYEAGSPENFDSYSFVDPSASI